MNLSRNFTLQELIKSDTAVRKGIDNNPNSDQIAKLKLLCDNILHLVISPKNVDLVNIKNLSQNLRKDKKD